MIAAAEISKNSHSHIKLGCGEEPANIGPACIQGGCNKYTIVVSIIAISQTVPGAQTRFVLPF